MLNKDLIKSILKEQKEKLLNRDLGVEREILESFGSKLKLPNILIITGIRRCGKSTLLSQIIKKYFSKANYYYINFDDERWVGLQAQDFNLIYESLFETFGEARTFFIDEIQNIKGFELFVRRFYDDGFKFIVTGSNSDLLSSELGSRLTGRHVSVNLYPFSFIEYSHLKKAEYPKDKIFTTKEKVNFNVNFENYFLKGGMPEYVTYNNDEALKQIYDDLVIKDIAVRFNISNINQLRELYIYLITNFGNRYNYTSLSKITSIQSTSTIINYLHYLELTFFAVQVRKFDFSLSKSQRGDKKIYIIDNGFINLLSQSFTIDKGRLFENLVFNHIKKDSEVYFYSGKRECDFITAKNRKVKDVFQACYHLNESNYQREIGGLLEAMEYAKLKNGYILTTENSDEIIVEGKKIFILPVWKWIMGF